MKATESGRQAGIGREQGQVPGSRIAVVVMLGNVFTSLREQAQQPQHRINLTDDINTALDRSLVFLQENDPTQSAAWAKVREDMFLVGTKHKGDPQVQAACEMVVAIFVAGEQLTTANGVQQAQQEELLKGLLETVPEHLLKARDFAVKAFGEPFGTDFAKYLQQELLDNVVPLAAQMYGVPFGQALQHQLGIAFQIAPRAEN